MSKLYSIFFSAAVSPLVSNKDIPPPPVTQRQPVALRATSHATAHKDERSSVLGKSVQVLSHPMYV